ncbi:MAG: HAD family hydrolase [Chloroflexi bacterium]|nr:HAD family hydrolase [Chloroflexota bacterium]
MLKAIVFDFDGLIVDTESAEYQAWQETYARYGAEMPLDVWVACIGASDLFDPYRTLEEQIGHSVDRDAVRELWSKRNLALVAKEEVMPGVKAYLHDAKKMGLAIGLASSSPHKWVDKHLKRLGLYHEFQVIRCRDDVGNRSKPDPAVYEAAVSALGIEPAQAMALEDSANGVLAAKRAGLWCTAVPNNMTRSLNFDHADYRLNSLADMSLSQLVNAVTNKI